MDVFAGDTAEIKTAQAHINACKQIRLGEEEKLGDAGYFDRGQSSPKPMQLGSRAQMKYISALGSHQIPPVGSSLAAFGALPSTKPMEP